MREGFLSTLSFRFTKVAPKDCSKEIIGTYFLILMVFKLWQITSKDVDGEVETHTMYFINDGVYGSFNCLLYDHQKVVAEPLNVSILFIFLLSIKS